VIRVLHVGGPTAVIEMGGLRFLTDPTFDPPGDYPIGARQLTKTTGPALPVDDLAPVDAVLLSHDQHPDNLDRAGRDYLARAPLTLSTPKAAERLGGTVRGLEPWAHHDLARPDGGALRVTAVPALHGPPGSEPLVGPVTGFVLSAAGLPVLYVSGDNASLDVVREIAARAGPIAAAVLFAGGARTPLLDAYLTLPSAGAVEAIRLLGAAHVVVIHVEGWAHFSEGRESLERALAGAGLGARVHVASPGEAIVLV
jgi:L-ascorbate metabolism protein UlaG (beta-lactamase superfamily)